jgi:hypothetical protein
MLNIMIVCFIPPNYAACKSHEEARQIIVGYYPYRFISMASMATLVAEVVIM